MKLKFGYILQAAIFAIMLLLASTSVIAQQSKADLLFENGKYKEAIEYYLKQHATDPDNIYLNYQIACCYLKFNCERELAVPFLERIVKLRQSDENVTFDLGRAYLHDHAFEKALFQFENYKSFVLADNAKRLIADRYIDYCYNAQAFIQVPLNIEYINLGAAINSKFAETNPFVTYDESRLVFSSNRKNFDSNIYMIEKRKNGTWSKPSVLNNSVNSPYDEFAAGISKQGDYLFVHHNESNVTENILAGEFDGKTYKNLHDIGRNVNTVLFKEEGAFISESGDTLLFSSNRPGGFGGLDLYISLKLPTGEWGQARNLGEDINTPFDENYPLIDDFGKLVFASKGHSSMGGYDIFSAHTKPVNGWHEPRNMGYPINDTYDNTNITMPTHNRYAYIAAAGKNSLGDLDLYKIVFKNEEADYLVVKGEVSVCYATDTVNVSQKDAELTIQVFKADPPEIYGVYALNTVTGKYLISVQPGKYLLVVTGKSYVEYRYELVVEEEYFAGRTLEHPIYLQKKAP